MESFSLDGWHEFFVMTGGAAAALAGLIVVAMSVNIKEILAGPSLTARAAAAIAGLMLVVVIAAIGLVPGQPDFWTGAEILLGALALWVFSLSAVARIMQPSAHSGSIGFRLLRSAFQVASAVPITVGAVLLMLGTEAGMAWVCVGVILAFVTSMLSAWVLLVEVLR